jgi:hypothetical protein
MMAERKLTIKQCLDLYDLPELISQSEVTCDWPTSIDIATNKEAVRAIAEGFRASLQKPSRVLEYERKAETVRMTEEGETQQEEMRFLNREYAADMINESVRQRRLADEVRTETKTVDIVPIKRDALSGFGKHVAIIASHLMPVMERGNGSDTESADSTPRRKNQK